MTPGELSLFIMTFFFFFCGSSSVAAVPGSWKVSKPDPYDRDMINPSVPMFQENLKYGTHGLTFR